MGTLAGDTAGVSLLGRSSLWLSKGGPEGTVPMGGPCQSGDSPEGSSHA